MSTSALCRLIFVSLLFLRLANKRLELELTPRRAMLYSAQVFMVAVSGLKVECCVVMGGETDQRFRYTLELQGYGQLSRFTLPIFSSGWQGHYPRLPSANSVPTTAFASLRNQARQYIFAGNHPDSLTLGSHSLST